MKPAVSQTNEKLVNEKSRRLTGRAATQRRHFETNYKDGESISASTFEFERLRKQDRDNNYGSSRDSNDLFHEKQNLNKYNRYRNEKSSHHGKYLFTNWILHRISTYSLYIQFEI